MVTHTGSTFNHGVSLMFTIIFATLFETSFIIEKSYVEKSLIILLHFYFQPQILLPVWATFSIATGFELIKLITKEQRFFHRALLSRQFQTESFKAIWLVGQLKLSSGIVWIMALLWPLCVYDHIHLPLYTLVCWVWCSHIILVW